MNQNEWKTHIEQWQLSGLSQSQYCKDKNLPVSSFYKHKNRILGHVPKQKKAKAFIPVSIENKRSKTEGSLDFATVAQLLRAFDKFRT